MSYTNGLDNPELYFQTKLYTGNGTAIGSGGLTVTFDGSENMQPDWVWIKNRDGTDWNDLYDSVRGVTKRIYSNSNYAENTNTESLTAFGTNGFTVGSSGDVNTNTNNHVAWCWKAGGSASSNSDGGTTSSVSANTTAGFSIVSWQGSSSSSNQTIGHGLGVAPSWILTKNRGSGDDLTAWVNYHKGIDSSAPQNYTIYLNNTDARNDNSVFGDTAPTSSVFTVNTATDDENFISYCFAEKKGYSKFGSYKGNGNADGTFVYTGFSPAWILVKRTNSSGWNWYLNDNKRKTFNTNSTSLFPNLSSAESSDGWYMDMLSNGFKMRGTGNAVNNSSGEHIYMAFAESPFVNSNGVPNNAR